MHEPALRAIRLHYPKAQIDAITDHLNLALLANHPAIHTAEIFPRKVRNFKNLKAYFKAIINIRRKKYDLMVNFYMGRATPMIAKLSGIPNRLAFDCNTKMRKAFNLLATTPSSYSNWIVETNELVRPLGITPESIWPEPKFFITQEQIEFAKTKLRAGQDYAAYQLATSDPVKCWPPKKYAQLAEQIYSEKGLIPVIISSPDQIKRVDEFFESYPTNLPSIRLPILKLDQLAGILSQVKILISGDTGIMHLGFALGTPTVCLYTNGRPEYASSATSNKIVVFRENKNIPKYPSGQLHGTKDLTVGEAYQATKELLMINS